MQFLPLIIVKTFAGINGAKDKNSISSHPRLKLIKISRRVFAFNSLVNLLNIHKIELSCRGSLNQTISETLKTKKFTQYQTRSPNRKLRGLSSQHDLFDTASRYSLEYIKAIFYLHFPCV